MEIKKALIILTCFGLCGCATADWNNLMYGNPQGQQSSTQPQLIGGICELCNREFSMTPEVANNFLTVTCPYDGHEQKTEYAANRYTYALQQQQKIQQQQSAAAFQQGLQNIQQIKIESSEKKAQLLQDYSNGLRNNRRRTTMTNCNPNGIGGFNCNTY